MTTNSTLKFAIKLTSDAEMGTGLGSKLVDQFTPRDQHNNLIIPASHIKGLMRESACQLVECLGWDELLITRCFGGHTELLNAAGLGENALFQITTATALNDAATTPVVTHLVTRTAIDSHSKVALAGSLRTVESIPKSTIFQGELACDATLNSVEELLIRLSLLAIHAIGGNRNRGSGQCSVSIEGEDRTTPELLGLLVPLMEHYDHSKTSVRSTQSGEDMQVDLSNLDDQPNVAVTLRFISKTGICCPETPECNNVLKTGFSIPASAVIGAVITRINITNPALASAIYDQQLIRAWPLLPCSRVDSAGQVVTPNATSSRVSLSHRVAKYTRDGDYSDKHFFDNALSTEPYDWRDVPDGAPLKASDGVIVCDENGRRSLWKATDMPHLITAQTHCNQRNMPQQGGLYTIDAMAPVMWHGRVVLPKQAAEYFVRSVEQDRSMAFGKSKSVRGLGEMQATIESSFPTECKTTTDYTVLVAQSPIVLEDSSIDGYSSTTAAEEFHRLISEWAQRNDLPAPDKAEWVSTGIQFGWNRHKQGRQSATRIIHPGATVTFAERIDEQKLAHALLNDTITPNHQHLGFGAVSVHPGKATGLYTVPPTIRQLGNADNQTFNALSLILKLMSSHNQLPSTSQIRAVQQRLEKNGTQNAKEYLQRQRTGRTQDIWETWSSIFNDIETLLTSYDQSTASEALKFMADLSAAKTPVNADKQGAY